MSSCLALFKIKFINNLQYRTAALAGLATQFFFGFVFIMIYVAFYSSGSGTVPMELNQLVSYVWLNQALFALIFIWAKDEQFLSMIKDGNIAYELCRPINFYLKWYTTMYASRISAVALRCLPVIIIAFILPVPYNLMVPPSVLQFIVFLIALLISSLLVTAIGIIYHLLTFFTLDEKGILSLLMVIGEIFSGMTIPIVFFPSFLQTIAYLLPFRYVCDLPFRIYSGNIGLQEAIPDLIGGIVWLIAILLLGYFISKKALNNAVIQGG